MAMVFLILGCACGAFVFGFLLGGILGFAGGEKAERERIYGRRFRDSQGRFAVKLENKDERQMTMKEIM